MADSFELEIKDDKPADMLGRFLWGWSKMSALGGVVILVGICLLSTASVIGRAVFSTPIKGDVELVQIGCALAIASFLPYAQMKKAHVIVDFFTIKAPVVVRKYLDIFAAVLLGMVALVLMWRSYFGAVIAFKNGTKTMILGLPEWWAHLTIAPGFFLLALTAFYTAWRFFKRYEAK